ncbi:unnamed protein product [Tetraodon nigroviridis]|uniref:(spotted green pufferfish) hypothetical protein n=1 Tax=Tetraodon nigroviridis TaxID=99883 RepID=Q4T3G3_TETNG|nr:unnamed protein product [Tetraodon nigroviridis]
MSGSEAEASCRVSDPQHSQKLLRVLRSFWLEQSFHDALLVVGEEELPVQKNILAAASPYIRSAPLRWSRGPRPPAPGPGPSSPHLLLLSPARTKLNYNPPKQDGSAYRIELQGVSMSIMKQILDYIFSGEVSAGGGGGRSRSPPGHLLVPPPDLPERGDHPGHGAGVRPAADDRAEGPVLPVPGELHHGGELHRHPPLLAALLPPPRPLRGHRVPADPLWGGGPRRGVPGAPGGEAARAARHGEAEHRERGARAGGRGALVRARPASSQGRRGAADEGGDPGALRGVLERGELHGEALLATFKPRGYSECIVVVGGEDRQGRVRCVPQGREATAAMRCLCPLYDTNRRTWIHLQPMSVARSGHGAVAAEGFLFVMGGADENKTVLDSGEKYDPDSNTWTPIPPMLQTRQNFGVVELDGLIYVLGGENEVTELTSVEVFDPHFNTWKPQTSMTMVRSTQQWTGLCPLKERRFGSVACGIGQELYVFGGVRSQETQNPERRQMMTCKSEFYHEEMRRWGGCRANRVGAGCRWMVLDDQNLCIQTSSSFIYGALPIRGDIYVVGDLDTGEWTRRALPPLVPAAGIIASCLQEPTLTTSGSSGAAPGGGTAPCPCCPRTCPSPPAPPCASPTAGSSTCSCARAPSASESSRRRRRPGPMGRLRWLGLCRAARGNLCGDSTFAFRFRGTGLLPCLGLFRGVGHDV